MNIFQDVQEREAYVKGHKDFFEEFKVNKSYTETLKPFYHEFSSHTIQTVLTFVSTNGQFFNLRIYTNVRTSKNCYFEDWVDLEFTVSSRSRDNCEIQIKVGENADVGLFYAPYIPMNTHWNASAEL